MADTMYDMELEAQQMALEERKALLKQRAARAAQQLGLYAPGGGVEVAQPEGYTSAVTGAKMLGPTVRRPAFAAAIPLIAEGRDAYERNQLTSDQAQYRAREQEAEQQALASYPRGTPATPTTYGAGNEGPTMTRGTPAVPATNADRLNWAAGPAGKVPSLRDTVRALVTDSIVKEPEREEARAERVQTRADTIAEARRKQREDLDYKRERDEEAAQLRRDLAAQQNDLRRDLHAAVRASSGGKDGDKASDYQIIQGDNGEVFRVGKRPGSAVERVDSATGKSSGTNQKDALETRDAIERSETAIREAPRARELLGQASSSGMRADIRRAGSYVAPGFIGGKALEADEALKPIGDLYLKSVPRFSGPTSDGDRKDYAAAAGQVANTNLPPNVRAAALDEVVRLHKRSIEQQRARGTSAPAASESAPRGPNIRDAVKQTQPGARSLTYNPATGKLE